MMEKIEYKQTDELMLPSSDLSENLNTWREGMGGYLNIVKNMMEDYTTYVDCFRPYIMNALSEATGVSVGDIIFYEGRVIELTAANFEVAHEFGEACVSRDRHKKDKGIDTRIPSLEFSARLRAGYGVIYAMTFDPATNTFNTNGYYDRRKYMRRASADDIGYSLPTIGQVKGWIRKMFKSCTEENVGVRLDYTDHKHSGYSEGSRSQKASDVYCSSLQLRPYKRGTYNRQTYGYEYENEFVARARMAPVAQKIKDYAERRGCIGDVVIDGDSMTIAFGLVKKSRAS